MHKKREFIKKSSFRVFIFLMLCTFSIFGQGLMVKPAQASSHTLPNDEHAAALGLVGTGGLAAVSWGPNRLDVFTMGDDFSVWHKYWTPTTGWSFNNSWESIGHPLNTHLLDVSAVSWGQNRLDVFSISQINSISEYEVWHRYWTPTSGWGPAGGWEDIGTIYDNPTVRAISWGPGRIDLFGTTIYHNAFTYHKSWDNSTGWSPSVTGWESFGHFSGTTPTVLSAAPWGVGSMDVFMTDDAGTTFHRYNSQGVWGPSTGWDNFGGAAQRVQVVSQYPNRMDVFTRGLGTDTNVYHKVWSSGAWSPAGTTWESLGGTVSGIPVSAVYSNAQRVNIFESRTDGIYYKYWNGSSWSPSAKGWTRQTPPLAGNYLALAADNPMPVVVSWGSNRLDLFTVKDQTIRHTFSNDGTTWAAWESLGAP